MKLVFDVNSIDSSVLIKMPTREELASYKKEMQVWEASDKSTPQPSVPELKSYKPMEAVYLVFASAIEDSYPATKTNNIRNILRIMEILKNQCSTNEDFLEIDRSDVQFLQRCIAKATWETKSVPFLKFIVSVENTLIKTLNGK